MKNICLLISLMATFTVFADEKFDLILAINGSEGEIINQVSIVSTDKFNEFNLKTTESESELTVSMMHSPIYQLEISANNYYPSIQTFSHDELFGTSDSKQIKIPTIKLVRKKAKRVMMAFGGDVMMGRRYTKPYFNEPVLIDNDKEQQTKNILQHIKPYMEIADFAAVNLESQISDQKPSQRAPKSVTFYSPPETIDALKWAGIDYVTLGNNHIYDYVDEGLESTLKFLKEKELPFSGAGFNQQQALKPYLWQHHDLNYDMLGFVGWAGGFTPNQVADINKGGSAFGTMQNITASVKASSKNNHATVVQYHGSLEYSDEPTGVTESRLKSAIDHGADLVIAHHPHVTQGLELYKDKLIAYSMGNFVFDQYFYATPHSYILYVWMDDEVFHRAEIVPIYLKGYQPTPAVGQQRNFISNRANYLSSKRQLHLTQSGGHLEVLKTPVIKASIDTTITLKSHQKIASLISFPIKGHMTQINSNKNTPYRLGVNQFNNGDFESFNLFTGLERGWFLDNLEFQDNKNNYLKTQIDPGSTAQVGMKNFRRVFKASSQMTFNALIKNSKPVKAELYLQLRKTRDKFFDAIEARMQLLDTILLPASENQQMISIDFNLPRVGYRSYRVMLKLTNHNNDSTEVNLDEFELIQWHGHYTASGTLPHSNEILATATHIAVQNSHTETNTISITYER